MATMATSMFDETDYECSVCLEFFEDPKNLNCGHVLCGGCVRKLGHQKRSILCPECKVVTAVPSSGLPTNYPLRSLTEKFKKFARSEQNCDYCGGNKIRVCEGCVGNSFQVLSGQSSAMNGQWKYESERNITIFQKTIGMGFFARLSQKLKVANKMTLFEMAGYKNWLVTVSRWFRSQPERWMMELNKTMITSYSKGRTESEFIRYNAAADCLERIVHETARGAEERSILYQEKQQVVDDKLVISYSTPSGVKAERVYRRLPLDLQAL